MAIAKSTRTPGRSQTDRYPSRAKKSPSKVRSKPPAEQLRDLFALRVRLRTIYGTATTVELALRQQAAEEDVEIADCLREGLRNALFDEIDRLEEIIRRCAKESREAKRGTSSDPPNVPSHRSERAIEVGARAQ